MSDRTGILLVCLGNICRSPTAEAVLRARAERAGLLRQLDIESAGTHDYHVGAAPDRRAQATAAERGYDLGALRARQVVAIDFERFDYILAMDRANLAELQALAGRGGNQPHLGLFLDFSRNAVEREIPDPYYGGSNGFDQVLDLVEDAAEGLLHHLQQRTPRSLSEEP